MKHLIYAGIVIALLCLSYLCDDFFASFLIENDLKELIKTDPKAFCIKRLRKSKISLLALLAWSYLDYSIYYFLIILFVFIFLLKLDYLKLKSEVRKRLNQIKFKFPICLRQLQILLQINTVEKSLELSVSQAPELIKDDLLILISQIRQDALNLTPYIQFLRSYHLSEVERAMKLLYRYNSVGKEDAYIQFNRMIQTTTKWLRNERTQRYESKLMAFQWIGMIPLIGVTILFMAIMFEILMNMFNSGF